MKNFKLLVMASLMSLTSLSALAQSAAKYDAADREVFKAVKLAQHRNEGNVCEFDAYQGEVLKHLRNAIKLRASVKSKIAGDPAIRIAMSGNLSYQELIGNLKGMVGLENVISKAYFEGVSLGVYGPMRMVKFLVGGKTTEEIMVAQGEELSPRTVKGTWKIISKGKTSAKIKLGSMIFTLKKQDRFEESEYILEAPGDDREEYKSNSLFNFPSECEA